MLGNIEPLDRCGGLAEWEDVKGGQEGQEDQSRSRTSNNLKEVEHIETVQDHASCLFLQRSDVFIPYHLSFMLHSECVGSVPHESTNRTSTLLSFTVMKSYRSTIDEAYPSPPAPRNHTPYQESPP